MCNFNAKELCQKGGNFTSKSKAIGLPFWPKINGIKNVHISWQKLCQKSGYFASKSKAIGLPFWPKINGMKNVRIYCQKIVPKKVVILHQKVRL